MQTLSGELQPGDSSSRLPAELAIDAQGLVSCAEPYIAATPLTDIDISTRIGNTPRYLQLPDGSVFETKDHAVLESWIDRYANKHRHASLIHRLESNGRLVLFTLLFTILFAAGFVHYGLPWLSRQAAEAVPAEIAAKLGSGTLQLLDEHLVGPTELESDRQQHLQQLFSELTPHHSAFKLRLVLRNGKQIGANAFALPDGTVLVTDQLVKLADNDEQIQAVMLHEIGHVQHRHALRRALQSAGLATVIVTLTGDVSTAQSVLVLIPTLLIEAGYSREMETEADFYALWQMQQQHLDPRHLLAFLQKLEDQSNKTATENKTAGNGKHAQPGWLDYLSSHPVGEKRLAPLRAALQP